MPDNLAPSLSPLATRLIEEYAAALRAYLAGAEQDALERAYQLGQRALSEGADVLEIAGIHHQALVEVLLEAAPELRRAEAAKALNVFCSACPAWSACDASGPSVPMGAAWTVLVRSLAPAVEDQQALRRSNAALLKLDEVREQEARRIAQSLHDDAAQLLASAYLEVEECAHREGIAAERMDKIRDRLDDLADRLRTLSHELRPPELDDFGLAAAVQALARGVAARARLEIAVEVEDSRFPARIETALYRIIQESLRNVVRHAHARRVAISVSCDGRHAACSVRDDGVGFEMEAGLAGMFGRGLGLIGIRERAEALGGTLRVSSRPGLGTEFYVRIPVATQGAEPPAPDGGSGLWLTEPPVQAGK